MADGWQAWRLLLPLLLLSVLIGARPLLAWTAEGMPWLDGGTVAAATTAVTALIWLTLAHLVVRLLDVVIWPRPPRRPPRLITDLVAALIWIAATIYVLGSVLQVPVAGIVTTSGVAVAVVGIALRDMLASLFAGIAVSMERPYHLGDWLEVTPGNVGRVTEVGWLTTRLVSMDGIGMVVPNAHFATRAFGNFSRPEAAWREPIAVVLDFDVSPQRAERILLAAAATVPGANATGQPPDARIVGLVEHGVSWQVRFWLDDYCRRSDLRHQLQAAVLRHLYQAGLAPAHLAPDMMSGHALPRGVDQRSQFDMLLARSQLFRTLGADDLHVLAGAARRRRIAAGTAVVREGDAGSSLFVVVEGVLDVARTAADGRARRVDSLAPGGMFGEFSLLTGSPRSATVTARTASLLFEITKDDLVPVLERHPDLAASMSRTLAARQSGLERLAAPEPGEPTPAEQTEHGLLERIRSFFGRSSHPES